MERTVQYTLNQVTDVSFAYLKFTNYLFHSLVQERGKWKGRGELSDEYSCMSSCEREDALTDRMSSQFFIW